MLQLKPRRATCSMLLSAVTWIALSWRLIDWHAVSAKLSLLHLLTKPHLPSMLHLTAAAIAVGASQDDEQSGVGRSADPVGASLGITVAIYSRIHAGRVAGNDPLRCAPTAITATVVTAAESVLAYVWGATMKARFCVCVSMLLK